MAELFVIAGLICLALWWWSGRPPRETVPAASPQPKYAFSATWRPAHNWNDTNVAAWVVERWIGGESQQAIAAKMGVEPEVIWSAVKRFTNQYAPSERDWVAFDERSKAASALRVFHADGIDV